MTNKERFVEVFGEESYNNLVKAAKESKDVDIFVWLLDEFQVKTQLSDAEIKYVKNDEKVVSDILAEEIPEKKTRRGGSRKGRGYDLKWYVDAVSDFYLGKASSIEFTLKDDRSSGKKTNTMDGFKSRWMVAVKSLGLEEEVTIHKYYKGTCNECICLEKPNFNNSKAAGFQYMR